MEATIVFVIFFFIVGGVTWLLYEKAKKDPELKGLEPGVLLARAVIKYNFTYLLGLQLAALIVEAALLGSVQDLRTNISVRMSLHMIIAAISLVGAFGLSKYAGMFFNAFNPANKMSVGTQMGIIATTGTLAFVMWFLAIGSPIVNMLAMANAVHNVGQLECFWVMLKVKFWGLDPSFLVGVIQENHYPPDFSPFANLHPAMMSSCMITIFHILVIFVEIVLALLLILTRKGIQHAVLGQMFDVPVVEKEEKEDKKEDEDKKEKKEKKVKAHDHITKALTFLGIPDVSKWADLILPYYTKLPDIEKGPKYSELVKATLDIDTINGGKATTMDNKTKTQLQIEVRTILENFTNKAVTLPRGKN